MFCWNALMRSSKESENRLARRAAAAAGDVDDDDARSSRRGFAHSCRRSQPCVCVCVFFGRARFRFPRASDQRPATRSMTAAARRRGRRRVDALGRPSMMARNARANRVIRGRPHAPATRFAVLRLVYTRINYFLPSIYVYILTNPHG